MATVLGPCGVIPKEFANVKCFNVDLPDERAIDSLPADRIARMIAEFSDPARGEIVAYRGRYRWQRDFERIPLAQAPPAISDVPASRGRLRRNGVYLITGGTGGIGLSISKYLAQTCQPVIVLSRQSAFPEKAAWKELSVTRAAPQRVLRTIDALLEIERCGASVEVQTADVTDRVRMQAVLRSMQDRHGALNGVIHAAGIVSAELIQSKSRGTAHRVLAPKVYGTMILLELLKDLPLDFLVLFSSITAIETAYAHCDYSAANCFLDACTYAANARYPFHTLTINWPGWREIGQLADLQTAAGLENWKKAALEKAISTRDGVEAFARALHSGLKQVIVSPEDVHEVLARARIPLDPSEYLSPSERGKPAAARAPDSAADAPGNDVESALAEIWKSILGLERVGIHEPFSQLGGHSLLAMQIVSKVRAGYEIRLSLREFFEAPTIAELSRVIQAKIVAEIESIPDEQARRLVTQPHQ
jgi:NAD(P)-dependent dehydrogenase (short-subunit alcohol dehydrogenase family)/acyl carrier protein